MRPTPRPGAAHSVARAAALATATLLVACSKPAGRELQPGSYRAVLQLPDRRELPFGLDVAREESGYVLYLINGDERVRVPEVDARPGTVTARLPGYETTLTASIAGGELTGTVTLVHGDAATQVLPLRATLGETWRFHAEPLTDNADLAGRWRLAFAGGDARAATTAIADLTQAYGEVTGTVLLAGGDQGLLAGEVRDEELRLSRFDGGAALLYVARLDRHGALVGEAWTDRGGSRRFVASRDPDADVDAAAHAPRLRQPDARFTFAFPDLDGTRVSSDDARLAGKALLVTLAGSWNPNSHAEARLLTRLDRQYRGRGLAIVSLMFEQHADPARAAAAIRRYRDSLGIDYPTLSAGTADPAAVARALPQLDAVPAWPTTLFVDRTGRVRKVLAGFPGPATGLRHELRVQEYEQAIEQLLGAAS